MNGLLEINASPGVVNVDVEAFLPLSPREFHILLALAEAPQNGYRVALLTEENSRGRVLLSPATQYTNLHRLVDRGLIAEVTDQVEDRADGRGQRFWTLTETGRGVLRAEAARLAADAALVFALGEDGA
jgi:DNA-binding PadR family transcriptional regulator